MFEAYGVLGLLGLVLDSVTGSLGAGAHAGIGVLGDLCVLR